MYASIFWLKTLTVSWFGKTKAWNNQHQVGIKVRHSWVGFSHICLLQRSFVLWDIWYLTSMLMIKWQFLYMNQMEKHPWASEFKKIPHWYVVLVQIHSGYPGVKKHLSFQQSLLGVPALSIGTSSKSSATHYSSPQGKGICSCHLLVKASQRTQCVWARFVSWCMAKVRTLWFGYQLKKLASLQMRR